VKNREVPRNIKQLLCCALVLFSVTGCMPKELVRVDLDTYLKNQAQYKYKHVVITATLNDVVEKKDLYLGREIELAAPVVYHGRRSFWTWYVLLEKDRRTLRCYAYQYRREPDIEAVNLALTAQSNGDDVTVRGTLRSDGLDLSWLFYRGYAIDASFPLRPAYPFR